MEARIGKEFAGYRIVDVLGRGGMGTVYKAEDAALGRFVAIKMLDPALARDASFLRRFTSEARALARLNDQNIVGIFAMPATDEGQFLVMEYVDGPTISEVLRSRGVIPWQEAMPILVQFLTAIQHAHEAGIIHRDIKPSNVMLTSTGVVKVADFGLAKLEEAGDATKTQGMAGTLSYMSPEQVRGLANVDARSDIYSAGMTAFEILTGRVPFDTASGEFAILKAIVEQRFPSPTHFNAGIPKALAQIVQKAIEKDPGRRYQSAAEMLAALENFADASDATMPARRPPSGVHPRPPLRNRRRPMLLAGAVVLILAVVGLGAFLLRGTGAAEPVRQTASPPADSLTTRRADLPLDTAGFDDARVPALDAAAASAGVSPEAPRERPRAAEPDRDEAGGSAPPAAHATLAVQAGAGGVVVVDGQSQGAGATLRVPAGRHQVSCRHSATATTAEMSVEVRAGEEKAVTCYVEQQLNVGVTDVSGARTWATVSINGEMVGPTPLIRRLPPGTYRVAVSREGYVPVETEQVVEVAPGFEEKTHRLVFQIRPQ